MIKLSLTVIAISLGASLAGTGPSHAAQLSSTGIATAAIATGGEAKVIQASFKRYKRHRFIRHHRHHGRSFFFKRHHRFHGFHGKLVRKKRLIIKKR